MNKQIATISAAFILLLAPVGFVRCAAGQRILPTDIPGGVTDSSGQIGYVIGLEGGVDAVNLATGQQRWHADGDLIPLLVIGQELIVRTAVTSVSGESHFVALDAKGGQKVFASQALVFPQWVSTDDRLGSTFKSRTYVEAGTLFFLWYGRKEMFMTSMRRPFWGASGMAKLNLTSGNVTLLPLLLPYISLSKYAQTNIHVPQKIFTLKEGAAVSLPQFNFEYPRTLQCTDASTGELLWEHPLKPRHESRNMPLYLYKGTI